MVRKRDNLLWWKIIHKRYFKSRSHHHHKNSNSSIIVLHTNEGRFSSTEELNSTADTADEGFEFLHSQEDIAAITIQACFRSHLARRAFIALKSLVKLQALVRGVIVRRQARIALCCMNALARLQITVRSRQLLHTRQY